MIDVAEKVALMMANFINKVFLFEIEFQNTGEFIPIGKIILAVSFFIISIYLIMDAMGYTDTEGE